MEKLFLSVLNMSLIASVMVVVAVFVRLMLKKAPRWIVCLLWGLVAVRLVCPFSFESVLSLIPSAEPIPQEITLMENPQIDTGIYIVNNVVNPIISDTVTSDSLASVNKVEATVRIASYIWLFGIVCLTGYAVVSYIMLYRKTKGAISVGDRIKISDYIETPFILGIIRPFVYVPSGISDEQFKHIIAHENAHLKRLDYLWKPMGFIILSIHWFNPFVWIAYIMLCKDIEIACDEKVIRELAKNDITAYAQTLLNCSQERRIILMCPIAFGEVSVKERIKHVLSFKKPAFWIILVAVIVCAIVAVCFLTNPKREEEPGLVETNIENNSENDSMSELELSETTEADNADTAEEALTFEEAIYQEIIKHGSKYAPASGVSEYKVASFIKLEEAVTDGTVEERYVKGMAMYMEANVTDEGIEETSSLHIPVILTFEVVDGNYVLKEWWESGEGAFYGQSIVDNFLPENVDIVMNSQTTTYVQHMDCYNQIIQQSGMDTDIVIRQLLNTICSSPLTSSNPTDYIREWPIEYRELLYYGQYTLDYKEKYVDNMEGLDLQAAILEEACDSINESMNPKDVQIMSEVSEFTYPITEDVKLEIFAPSDINKVEQVIIVLKDNTAHIIRDKETIGKLEKMISSATEVKGFECSYNLPVSLLKEDGTVMEIYPATDGCDNFKIGNKCYDWGSGDGTEFWRLLGLEINQGNVDRENIFSSEKDVETLIRVRDHSGNEFEQNGYVVLRDDKYIYFYDAKKKYLCKTVDLGEYSFDSKRGDTVEVDPEGKLIEITVDGHTKVRGLFVVR